MTPETARATPRVTVGMPVHNGERFVSMQTSDDDQQQLRDPEPELYLWRHSAGYLRAIGRGHLPATTKLRIAAMVARRSMTARMALARARAGRR